MDFPGYSAILQRLSGGDSGAATSNQDTQFGHLDTPSLRSDKPTQRKTR